MQNINSDAVVNQLLLIDIGQKDGEYSLRDNSCVTNTIDILRSSGMGFNEPNGIVSPYQLQTALSGSSYTKEVKTYSESSFSDISGTFFYSLGVSALKTVSKMNTVPLLPK